MSLFFIIENSLPALLEYGNSRSLNKLGNATTCHDSVLVTGSKKIIVF